MELVPNIEGAGWNIGQDMQHRQSVDVGIVGRCGLLCKLMQFGYVGGHDSQTDSSPVPIVARDKIAIIFEQPGVAKGFMSRRSQEPIHPTACMLRYNSSGTATLHFLCSKSVTRLRLNGF